LAAKRHKRQRFLIADYADFSDFLPFLHLTFPREAYRIQALIVEEKGGTDYSPVSLFLAQAVF